MAGYLQVLAPGVAAQAVEVARLAWLEAKWNDYDYADPAHMGLRTIEHLQYNGGGQLGAHRDSESAITVVVALSDPDDYDGGEYVLYTPNESSELQRIKLDRLSALVFLSSEVLHGVAPITGGVREMLAVELWNEDDVPYDGRRPNVQSFHEQWLNDASDTDQEDL
jgi:predicted 2-oxoglutarate/Fe(II)-dependent dioxygenase YbiX